MSIARNAVLSILIFPIVIQGKQTSAQTAPAPSPPGMTVLEAVESTLLHHPLLKSQEAQVEVSRGLREEASAAFDAVTQGTLAQQRTLTPLTVSQQEQDKNALSGQTSYLTNYSLTVSRLFRNGVAITPGVVWGRSTDNMFNTTGVNSSSMSLLVTVPLLRGRGRQVVAAAESAAIAEVDASVYDLNELISELITSAATSYWNLVAARKSLAIAYEAESRGKAYVENVQALVDADHAPRNDLNEVTANYAQRTSTRIAAEQQVVAAQTQLGLDIGLSPEHILNGVFEPADPFPEGEDQKLPSNSTAAMQYYLEEALQRRPDYLAAQRRSAENKMLLTAARNKVLPQLNLNFASGYSGLQEGRTGSNFFVAPFSGVQGPNVNFGFTYIFPGSNQAAHGALRQATAVALQGDLKADQVARTISGQVAVALEGLRNSILRLKKAREAVEAFQSALNGEREKYRGGIGSIVDVLTVEDKLNSALSDQVQAQQGYAIALTQFRFATGTLLPGPATRVQKISGDMFFTIPFTGAPQEQP